MIAVQTIMQTIYDGSKDPICKNVVKIIKDQYDRIILHFNNANYLACTDISTRLTKILDFDYYIMLVYKAASIRHIHRWHNLLLKKTGMYVNIIISETAKFICYNNRLYIWQLVYKQYKMTIVNADGTYKHYDVPENFNANDTELIMLIKSTCDYDPRLVGTFTELYKPEVPADHFDQNGRLIIYCNKQTSSIKDGFEDLVVTFAGE